LWVEYGSENAPSRILIDGGRLATFETLSRRIENMEGDRRLELFVITHYDNDHIDAALQLLNSANSLSLKIQEVWFNEFQHLPVDELGPWEAEIAGVLIDRNGVALNKHFNGKAVMLRQSQILPTIILEGGMRLTLLSPRSYDLSRLRREWAKIVKSPGDRDVAPHRFEDNKRYADVLSTVYSLDIKILADERNQIDNSPANSSSIAFLAEFDGKSCLFGADASPSVLIESLGILLTARNTKRLKIDAYKVSHHGSRYNTTKQLLDLLDCSKYLISTNGRLHGHPDEQGIARIIQYGGTLPQLYFNYASEKTLCWNDDYLKKKYCYQVFLPPENKIIIL
jgi:hypothetical protein